MEGDMFRGIVFGGVLICLGGCASVPSEATEAARAECHAQGVPEGTPMQQCVTQMEEAVRAARENGGAPPARRAPNSTPSRPPR